MSKPQLIVAGSIAIDRIMNFSGRYRDLIHPEKLHVLSLSVLLDKLQDSRGGIGANIAVSSAQLGESPILLGAVGSDAKEYIADLSSQGIVTDFIRESQLPTASFSVITDSEDSQVGGFYPGAMGDIEGLGLERWQGKDVFMVVSAHSPAGMKQQVAECRQYNFRLMYDPGQQVSNLPAEDIAEGVDAAEVLIVNDYEMGTLCKVLDTTEEALKAKVPIVITTLGKEGSVIEGAKVSTPIRISVATPDSMVDPTGAGDAYRAGFLYGYLREWELDKCARLGAVVASFIIERHGTQVQFSKSAILQRYQQNFNQEIQL